MLWVSDPQKVGLLSMLWGAFGQNHLTGSVKVGISLNRGAGGVPGRNGDTRLQGGGREGCVCRGHQEGMAERLEEKHEKLSRELRWGHSRTW